MKRIIEDAATRVIRELEDDRSLADLGRSVGDLLGSIADKMESIDERVVELVRYKRISREYGFCPSEIHTVVLKPTGVVHTSRSREGLDEPLYLYRSFVTLDDGRKKEVPFHIVRYLQHGIE